MSTPRSIGSITKNVLKLNGLYNASSGNNPPEQKKQTTPPQAEFMHPIFTQEDFKNSLALYNKYIKKYNMEVWIAHKEIRKFNKEVIRHRRAITLTKEQKIQEFIWKEENKDLEPEAYNEAVEKYNEKHGPQFRKKNLKQEVKADTEKYFLAFLYQYNAQLFKRKQQRAGLNVHVNGELPKFQLYPNKIIEAERDGCKILPVSVETVRHHRERLEAAGILTGYSYHGPNRPVKIAFNTGILSLTDNGMPKSAQHENQSLTRSQTNKVPHNNVSSRLQCLEESKSRDKGADSRKNESANSNCTRTSTRTPREQIEKKTDAAAKKFTGAPKKLTKALQKHQLSAVLTASLSDSTDLSRDLATGKHDNYAPLHKKIAQQEAYYGAMHPADFKELAIQDVFKFSASLFSSINAHPGSWMNAYKIWLSEEFKNFNGQQLSKPNLLARWIKMIEVLRQVKKYQAKHKTYTPTFPSLYFDTARKEKHHNSFTYAFHNFKLEDGKVESYQKRKVLANKSTRYKTDLEKARTRIRQYINGSIALQEVYDYVYHVCGKEISENVNKLIKKEFEAFSEAN